MRHAALRMAFSGMRFGKEWKVVSERTMWTRARCTERAEVEQASRRRPWQDGQILGRISEGNVEHYAKRWRVF